MDWELYHRKVNRFSDVRMSTMLRNTEATILCRIHGKLTVPRHILCGWGT